jgi:Xaa-Pro aminopeptidase
MNQLNNEFFTENRRKLSAKLGDKGVVFIAGNALLQRSGDTNFPFRQESNFYYLTGVNEPSAFLVMDLAAKTAFLSLPIRQGIHAIFDGTQNLQGIKHQSGIDEILDIADGWKRLSKLNLKKIFSIVPLEDENILANPFPRICLKTLERDNVKCEDISKTIASMRMIKTANELDMMSRASAITYATLNEIENTLALFESEKVLEAEITKQFSLRGAAGHAYQPIIASGQNSCTLHYVNNNQRIKNDSVILLDVGAEVSNYAADISRTFTVGKPTSLELDVINYVNEVQREIIKEIMPGMTFRELAQSAHHKIATQLVRLGAIDEKYSKKDVSDFFPHGVSHFIGLDVHDVGDYELPLEENMTITVEPGIYWKEKGVGARIEDDIVITKNGAQIIGDNSISLL